MDSINIFVVFGLTIVGLMAVIEAGYQLGSKIYHRANREKEAPVFAVSAATLGLLAFMLALTFGMAADRLNTRKTLLRDEANAIGTAYLRADFLPEPDRTQARQLFKGYTDDRITAATAVNQRKIDQVLADATRIQGQLWEMAVRNASRDPASHVAALYVESLNQVIDIHALRVSVTFYARIPGPAWIVLYALIFLSMISIGFQTGIAGSRRSLAILIMAVSFAMVLSLIVLLDRPGGGIVLSQQPLVDARNSMN